MPLCRACRGHQSGQAIPLIGLLVVILIGMAGLVVDGGQLTSQYRASQNAADAAALTAAIQVTNGSTEAYATAQASIVAVQNQIPSGDLSLAYRDSNGALTSASASVTSITATVTHQFPTLFLPIVGIDSGSVSTTATVTVTQGGGNCVLCVMSSTAAGALDMSGNAGLSLTGGNVVVNSTSAGAITIAANASLNVSGGKAYAVGGVLGSGLSHIIPAAVTGSQASPDPFSSVAVPSGATTRSCCSTTMDPGIYSSISVSGNSAVTMNPGTYVVTSSLSVSGNGRLTGHGVTIYLACSGYPVPCNTGQAGAPMTVTGNAAVDFSAPTYGTYQGMTVMSDRKNTSSITFGGNGSARFVGTVYALAGSVSLSGNGSNSTINSRIAANQVAISGNGNVAISYTQSANYVIPNTLTLTN
jgi:Flp pilus assembly protein TadG